MQAKSDWQIMIVKECWQEPSSVCIDDVKVRLIINERKSSSKHYPDNQPLFY